MSTVLKVDEALDMAAEVEHDILTPQAIEFLRALHQQFELRRLHLLKERRIRQAEFDRGLLPRFRQETQHVRDAKWTVAPIPQDLIDRRVEITGPPDRKMIINALNCGANVFMADFEDSNSPSWENCIEGQRNLCHANDRTIEYRSSDGKLYQLGPNPAVLFVRPRGWHMVEKHFVVDGAPISASLFDFGLYFFHNVLALRMRKTAPYFYLPKLEAYEEARLWNEVFLFAQEYLGIPKGTIRATVLIETITAAYQMDEILYELRAHSAGLNCGRWDYIFSFIKKFRNRPDFILPQRNDITMDQHFLRSYVDLLIHTCHKRGAHAIGGMAAQIPIRNDYQANQEAMERVKLDKLREVWAGHDGTWVAHPGLVPVAKSVFNEYMRGQHQIHCPVNRKSSISETDLLELPQGRITAAGLRRNIDVALQYIESWLRGNGCVPIYNLMEDAATAEISRAQIWQWISHGALLEDGRKVTVSMVEQELQEILHHIKETIGVRAYFSSRFDRAATLLRDLTTGEFQEFLTTAAYKEFV
jgi:malate synthase